MKRNLFLHWIAVGVSTLVSLFSGHGLMAKPIESKELSKNGKKARSAETRAGEESPWAAFMDQPVPTMKAGLRQYPWREAIVTTTFWVGEKPTENNPVPNHKSSWDTRWAENYGGTDTPKKSGRTSAYTPAGFTPRQNPFYVALPYNDMTSKGHKAEAATVIPWFKDTVTDSHKSVCKGRWIAIRRGDRVAYAQWEDAGPFRTDHWEYVFGNERPKPNLNKGAGLDVSPAVRDYLGMDDTDVTDWKFVEFDEVPLGPWANFGDNNTFVINRRAQAQQVAELREREHATTAVD